MWKKCIIYNSSLADRYAFFWTTSPRSAG